jgi:hypothetical protein
VFFEDLVHFLAEAVNDLEFRGGVIQGSWCGGWEGCVVSPSFEFRRDRCFEA